MLGVAPSCEFWGSRGSGVGCARVGLSGIAFEGLLLKLPRTWLHKTLQAPALGLLLLFLSLIICMPSPAAQRKLTVGPVGSTIGHYCFLVLIARLQEAGLSEYGTLDIIDRSPVALSKHIQKPQATGYISYTK